MVRGAVSALTLALAWASVARSSVLVPTYVLPPESFLREQRSLAAARDIDPAESQRTIKRLIGGHMKIKSQKEYGDARNSLTYDDKIKSEKFVEVYAPELMASTVGWNQGIWDDGMLMSSAGEGKDAAKIKEVDEDKKTLSDQVAEGKYGLIQNEIFAKDPKRPGIVSYEPNSETRTKDNIQTLGGLKKDEIWLAEDHLLVLKGGSYPERTSEAESKPWPPIDDYEAPRRQVKLPQKPKVPPPFPVQLSDNGPLVFLTPNGSVPAAFFPPYPTGESEGPLPSPPFPFPQGALNSPSGNPGNSSAGGASLPIPPFPFLSGNASEGAFPYPLPMNGSFPEGYPPGAAFLPPPSNQSDLYDEDDPSIYYPPPYSFSYHADYNSSVPAGPLVPGIILPPPPDFFALQEEKTTEKVIKTTRGGNGSTHTRQKTTHKRPSTTPSLRNKYKSRPTTTESITTEAPTTVNTPPTVEIVPTIISRKPQRIQASRVPVQSKEIPIEIMTTPKTEKPVYKTRTKLTSKPLSVFVIDEYPESIYEPKGAKQSDKQPYVLYKAPENTPNSIADDTITSTPVPLRAFYSISQSNVPVTKLEPVYTGQTNDNAVTSFYFYEEQQKPSPSPAAYFDGRNYYKTVPSSPAPALQQNLKAPNPQTGFNPTIDVTYGSIDQSDPLFLWPQKQGPRTLTQEYFSIQRPQQPVYAQQQQRQRPDPFYQQVKDIQQTIELYTTKRPKTHSHRPHVQKPKIIASRPVYEFSYQSKPKPEQFPFRAPKLDPEPFRPMVSYSKPFSVENEFHAITQSASPGYEQYLIENLQVTTEIPTSTRYYPKSKPRDEDYDTPAKKDLRLKQNLNVIPINDEKPIAVQHASSVPNTTPNPISHGYYTKQDEKLFDAITKNSFDVFGKKIEDNSHDVNGLAVTPPLETVRTPIDNGINLEYAYEIVEPQNPNPPSLDRDTIVNDRLPRPDINADSEPIEPQVNPNAELVELESPVSLSDDTLVNDRIPRPTINPNSEFIPIANPGFRPAQSQRYRAQNQVQRPQFTGEQYDLNRPSLADDTAVNYRRPLRPINADAEWITPVNAAGEGRPGSFVSYRLPGEGAHVYFLTPQAAQATRERYRAPGYRR